jgi:hypothetical protein
MFYDVSILLQTFGTDRVNLFCVDKIVCGLMDVMKTVSHLLSSRTAMCVHLLRRGDILPNEHPDIRVIKLPVLEADRISISIGASDMTIDVTLQVCDAKEQVHRLQSSSLVLGLTIQHFVDLGNRGDLCYVEAWDRDFVRG